MMKGQKGITLVALIITIIVMLILVAVTISIALNGGLFEKAREASKETKASQVKEAITLAKAEVLASYYENINTSGGQVTADDFEDKVESYLQDVTVTIEKDGDTAFKLTDTSDDEIDSAMNLSSQAYVISFGDLKVTTGN